MKNKKVLITGVTGFLGSNLARKLLKLNFIVIGINKSNKIKNLSTNETKLIKIYKWKAGCSEKIFKENKNIDFVIHTATNYGRNSEKLQSILESNLLLPLELIKTAENYNIKVFINTDTFIEQFTNYYSMSKNQFLQWFKFFSKKKLFKFVNIKLEHLYGQGDDDNKFTTYIIKQCIKNNLNIKLTKGMQKRDYIYIDDAVNAFVLILKKHNKIEKYFKHYDLGSGKTIRVKDFVFLVSKLTNSKSTFDFGAIKYRENELMKVNLKLQQIKKLGWSCNIKLEDGLSKTIEHYL